MSEKIQRQYESGDGANASGVKPYVVTGTSKQKKFDSKTRIYTSFMKHQQKEMANFLQRGFLHDESMVILERGKFAELPQVKMPEEVTFQPWKMETDAEQHQFIETHRSIFPRHPYSTESLRELISLPGWNNFTAFSQTEIAGNIMVFIKRDDDTVGYI